MTSPYDFMIYTVGLVYASVCTSLTDDETTNRLNGERPTGIKSRWTLAQEDFADGTPNGRPCPDLSATHRHLLFVC